MTSSKNADVCSCYHDFILICNFILNCWDGSSGASSGAVWLSTSILGGWVVGVSAVGTFSTVSTVGAFSVLTLMKFIATIAWQQGIAVRSHFLQLQCWASTFNVYLSPTMDMCLTSNSFSPDQLQITLQISVHQHWQLTNKPTKIIPYRTPPIDTNYTKSWK